MIHETDIVRDIGYQDVLKRVRRILYVSHFTREFLQLTFQFNLVVWLVQTESGLFLISLYQSMVNFSVLALVPILSSHIDEAAAGKKLNRKQFSSYVIIAENVCVLVVTLAFSLIIFNIDKGNGNRGLVHCLVGISCLFGASYQVLYEILRITMERDWIVVMASGDDNWLQKTNVVLKQTHLISKILSPVITGEILNNNSGIFWIGGCAVLSLLIELKCIDQMYELLPSLQEPQQRFGEKSIDGEDDNTLSSSCSCRKKIEVYTSQSMVWAGLAYALLYSNVSF
jgi:iron-regulated transporter 1